MRGRPTRRASIFEVTVVPGVPLVSPFTIAEVAERLRVSTRTVRRWIEAGDLVAHRFGGIVRIAETDLRAFLALHRGG